MTKEGAGASRRTMLMAVLLLCCICGVGGCGQTDGSRAATPTDESANASKLAASLQERIRFVLDTDGASMQQEQIDMLDRALRNGARVSRADYEQAWENYQQCMISKGYTREPVQRYANGLYASSSATNTEHMTKEQVTKFDEDYRECRVAYVLYVDETYRMAAGNADLLIDPSAGTVQCLRAKALAPKNYTARQFSEEKQKYYELVPKYQYENALPDANARAAREAFSIDLGNAGVMTCLVANGWDPPVDGQQRWKPLG